MIAKVTILETNFDVEYDINITQHAIACNGWDEPGEACEFDVTVHSATVKTYDGDVERELPDWLKGLIAGHLHDRDDIVALANESSMEYGDDPDTDRIYHE